MFRSPFTTRKRELKKEPSFSEKTKDFLVDKLHDSFMDFIPSDDIRQMPPQYLYPFGCLSIIFLFGIFLAVFLTGYFSQINTQYLSPIDGADSKYCDNVPISNSGIYYATQTGQWSGEEGFSYSLATYALSITNLQLTEAQYETYMWQIYQGINLLGEYAYNNTLGINVLFWMTYVWMTEGYTTQRFFLTGSPKTVFQRQKTAGGMSNINYDCVNISTSSFDQANGVLEVEYDYQQFMSSEYCSNIAEPDILGYSPYANPRLFNIEIDVQTLITAVAVNLGFLGLRDLQLISKSSFPIEYDGEVYTTSEYVNAEYPDMQPVTCIANPPRCVMILNKVIALPIFNHLGVSTTYPEPCNCTTLHASNASYSSTDQSTRDYFVNCNLFRWLSGVVFYNTTSTIPILQLSLNYTYQEILDYSFYPMFVGSTFGINSPYYSSQMNTPENRKKLYEFCYNPGENMYCSFITFASFDLGYPGWSVSQYYYQLTNGACSNSLSTSPKHWNDLIQYPYAPLTQQYEKCRYSSATVVSNQAGIAVGNVSILAPFAALFVLMLVYLYQWCTGKVITKGYTQVEKDQAIEALAIGLLLAKDDKLELLHKKYEKDIEKLFSLEEKEIEEGKRNMQLLVKELGVIGNITPQEYYQLRKDEFESHSSSINWKALYQNGFKKGGNKSALQSSLAAGSPDLRERQQSSDRSQSRDSTDSKASNNFELTAVNPLLDLPNIQITHPAEDSMPPFLPPQQSPKQNSPSSKSRKASVASTMVLQLLNQTKVNSKEKKKYEEYIKDKNLSFFSALYQSTVDKTSFRTVSLVSNSSLDGPSVDAQGILQMSRMLSSDGTFIQSLRPTGSTSVSHSDPSFDSNNKHQNGSKILEELYSAISRHARTSRYNAEVMKIMMEHWMPRIDRWSDEFGAMVEKIQYTQNNPQSKRGMEGVPASYWTISSMVGELQLFTLITKELLVKYVEELKAEEAEEREEDEEELPVKDHDKKENEDTILVQNNKPFVFTPIDISAKGRTISNNATPAQSTNLLPSLKSKETKNNNSDGNQMDTPRYDCSDEDYQMIFFLVIFYKKIQALLVYHSMLSLSIFQEEMILSQYERKVGYLIGREVWTLGELREWIARFQGILCN